MPNLELDFPLRDGRKPLPGFRLRRLEMLNWGTFHHKIAVLSADCRWTLLVGENGSGKSTAVDALRTLLVPPRLLNYNDASGDQKRRDRSRRSYVRGAWASVSQEDSATAKTEHLRQPGEYSVLLAVFANEQTGEEVTLAQILWELNEKIDERFAVARGDKSIKEHLSELGASRELKKTLRPRGFDVFDSFTAYAEVFRTKLGIPNEAALEVFNQAIGVKEVVDINSFIRRHMLEASDAPEFIHNRLRPHFNELDACWRAIERAEKQLEALAPIAECHRKIDEANARRMEQDALLEVAPIYYACRHRDLRECEANALAQRLSELNRQKEELRETRERDEKERDAKLQEIAADTTQQSIQRIESQLDTAKERFKNRHKRWNEFSESLRILNRAQPIESVEQFDRIRVVVEQEKGLIEGNRKDADEKRVKLLVEQKEALQRRGELADELETLRKHRVLIPREFVIIREAISLATGIACSELPFAGELMEVNNQFRDWTGAIERLLHQFGVSLLVSEHHYVSVAKFINEHNLKIRFTFHRVPAQPQSYRPDFLNDRNRVPGRLNFRQDHPLIEWVKGEVTRRFNHICCADVQRLKEVEFGLTREGLIRDGPTRHTKDDRRGVNDATNYVLGWSVENKIKALQLAFNQKEKEAETAGKNAVKAAEQVAKLDGQLAAIRQILAVESFAEIDFQSVQADIARLDGERRELEQSSKQLQTLKKQLQSVEKRIEENKTADSVLTETIGGIKRDQEANGNLLNELLEKLKEYVAFSAEQFDEPIRDLQETGKVSLLNILQIEEQVCKKLRNQIKYQSQIVEKASAEMLPKMSDFLRDYPAFTANLRAEPSFAADFAALRVQIDKDELPKHKKNFEEFLATNLIGDMGMFQTKLLEHKRNIELRIELVNKALRKVPFSDGTYVQIAFKAKGATDETAEFRAKLKECLRHGTNPTADERLRIFTNIRELISKFEKDDAWTRRVTDARNWLEFGVRELKDSDGTEKQYYSASSGKSGGQKTKLAFTILASAISAQYGLVDAESESKTFRLVIIDEAFARTDEANSQRALELFKQLQLQLIVVSPFDAKSRIVEDYVDSFHLAVNPNENSSKLRRASRAEYDAALENSVTGILPVRSDENDSHGRDANH